MPALFTFLFKVNMALVLFCLGYYGVLRYLTFYTLNRIYLVSAILFASVYPLINVNNFVRSHREFTGPVQYVMLQWKAPAASFINPLYQPNYWQWAEIVFWAGVILLALRLAVRLFSLWRLYNDSEAGTVYNYPVRLVTGDTGPFSFWRSIYINPDKLSPSALESVLEHEHVHVSQWHTLDILLAELSTVFYWFNPGVWLMKKAVRENIEFITDHKILQKGADSRQYQYSLLSVSMAGTTNKLVNNFNISTIKKRIIMMNAKKSSRINLTRYLLVAPAVVLLLFAFSISKAAISKTGRGAMKSFTSAIKSVTPQGNSRPVMLRAPNTARNAGKALVKTSPDATPQKADTIYAARSKDGKRMMLVTSDKSVDSVVYVINGAKTGRNDLLALDPAQIYSMDIMSAADATEFVDFTLDKPEVLFVTTDGSEKGRALKERIDKRMRSGNLSSGNSNADKSGTSYAYSVQRSGAGSTDVAPGTSGSNYSITTTNTTSADNAVKAYTNVFIAGTPKGKTGVALNGEDDVMPKKQTAFITIDSNGTRHVKYVYTGKNVVYLNKATPETRIDNFHNGVVYIIDGKEAKSLKGVSADDITTITVLRDEAAKKKYGEKAKNGVIVITTRSGGK